ncbi:helix-turn-helix domain-containing protein [Limosilactobacillus sp. STM2_1]|uniref:Helix-turn-helix domain-containing protein n=1 Tax=Limosilactobacillus rudii TaxID=2759755 RepID=A0A7W3UJD9_9LACO|nr:IclR family transcriptional regulator C-terminal domain-containing protein [Limosilactobacillus rudii]MBB1078464.1 helix-turn-helix domain-containing protein [Limosilactobacillus rudii]MBB1096594.1 helix-turn-helix domain-containing protein [Limosilactobacillus rudii]MCD7134210.1 helix-turn-helix domain-containing protein [Limosilactobacillus rudii]
MSVKLSKTLIKAKQVEDYIKSNPGVRLKEICQKVSLPQATCFRLLATLVYLGKAAVVDHRYYWRSIDRIGIQAGWQITALATKFIGEKDFPVYIGVENYGQIIIVQVVPRINHPEDLEMLAETLPVNLSAMGLCWTAFQSPAEQTRMLKSVAYNGGTKFTLRDQLDLKQAINIIHQQGYALDDEEKELGTRCLAVPILQNEQAVAVLGISAQRDLLKRRQIKALKNQLTKLSDVISHII